MAELARLENGGWRLLGENTGPVNAVALGPDDQPWLSLTSPVAGDTVSSLSIVRWNGLAWDAVLRGAFRNHVSSSVELAVNSSGQPGGIWATTSVAAVAPIAINVWQPVSSTCP